MFVGEYEHTLDPKGRVVLPAPFRAFVAERGFLTKLDDRLGLWHEEGFRVIATQMEEKVKSGEVTQSAFRNFMRNVSEVKPDAAGRITIPRELLERFGFQSQVYITGRWDRVEIIPAHVHEAEVNSVDADAELADTVRRLGL
jgi:MraZ protein